TGVGKSSLIDHVFGVGKKTVVAHDRPGEASIDDEFISPENDRFVLHDSKGFEPGDEDNLNIVQDFIRRRRAMPDLKDQLHAVWLCFQIPYAGGRFLETGTEKFLTWKRDGILGDTEDDYRETLARLIEITEKYVGQHSTLDAAVMTSIAQRVHPGLKIEALIEVGKKRYWKALESCPSFKNRKMQDCLDVLHADIVDVWNFRDPQKVMSILFIVVVSALT
ncbi:hypothetical protein BDR06DRAFT_881058, partial [Suillus hirtellus]